MRLSPGTGDNERSVARDSTIISVACVEADANQYQNFTTCTTNYRTLEIDVTARVFLVPVFLLANQKQLNRCIVPSLEFDNSITVKPR